MKNQVDYIIVGQGLAGSLLAWLLLQEGKSVQLIDNQHHNAASAIAAGVINPITGRRFVKSWMFDTLSASAKNTYLELEKVLNTKIYHEKNILRVLFNQKEENDWLGRSADPAYAPYMIDDATKGKYEGQLTEHFGMGELQAAAQVDIPNLIDSFREYFLNLDVLLTEKINYSDIYTTDDGIEYKDWIAQKIVFCEGQQARSNPFFNYLPFVPAKGEVLIVRIANVQFAKMLKHRLFIVPLKDDLYWIGSSYEWDFEDEKPSEHNKVDLLTKLKAAIHTPFEVVEHHAAIRPTVKDRRPFLGIHPDFPELAIFNGLGTKGASLAPYWAKEMVAFLLGEQALEKQVDIARFGEEEEE